MTHLAETSGADPVPFEFLNHNLKLQAEREQEFLGSLSAMLRECDNSQEVYPQLQSAVESMLANPGTSEVVRSRLTAVLTAIKERTESANDT